MASHPILQDRCNKLTKSIISLPFEYDHRAFTGTAVTFYDTDDDDEDDDPPQLSRFVQPPTYLQELSLHETSFVPDTPIEITRVALHPDIFVARNVLASKDCQELIDYVGSSCKSPWCRMQTAETKTGITSHRTNSSVAWISSFENLEIADVMTSLACQLFLNEALLLECQKSQDSTTITGAIVEPENVQVAHYHPTGRFDLHHDGMNRIVTVLTYLNGIAGAWFPFAEVDSSKSGRVEVPSTLAIDGNMTQDKVPGSHGLLIATAGTTELNIASELSSSSLSSSTYSPHVVEVSRGDAVIFYNYNPKEALLPPTLSKNKEIINDWQSMHTGLPAPQEKWIATNWIEIVLESV